MLGLKQNKKGFTLIELIVVIAIVGVLAAVAVPSYIAYIDKSRAAADSYTLGELNEATRVYYAEAPSPNPFELSSSTNATLMQALVGKGFFTEAPVPKQADVAFTWDFNSKVWLLSADTASAHVLTVPETTLGSGGHAGYLLNYSGTDTQILIPNKIGNVSVTTLYQNAFANKGLTSVTFPADSSITHIHARAFDKNNLTEITLPSSLKYLDYGAFWNNNNLTKVTIGSGVTLQGQVFQNNDKFNAAYAAGGAGTYIYTSGQWVKQ